MNASIRQQAAAIDAVAAALVAALDPAVTDDLPRISPTQMRVLALLQDGAVNVNGLAETLGGGPSSASRLCDRLEALGFVARVAASRDRREVLLQLTIEAREVLDTFAAQRQAALADVLSRMPVPARADLVRSLEVFARAAVARSENARGGFTATRRSA